MLCLWLIHCSFYGSYLVFKWLKRCHTVPLASSLIFFCWVRERACVILHDNLLFYVINNKNLKYSIFEYLNALVIFTMMKKALHTQFWVRKRSVIKGYEITNSSCNLSEDYKNGNIWKYWNDVNTEWYIYHTDTAFFSMIEDYNAIFKRRFVFIYITNQ